MAMAIGLVGGVVSAVGSIMGGQANAAMYNYQAQIAQMNAGIARQQAAMETATGELQGLQEGMKIRAQKSQQRAAAGAGGLDINSGSPAAVQESIGFVGKIDQADIRYRAATRAYGDEVAATGDIAQANLDRMGASAATTAGTIGAVSGIVGGLGKAFGESQQASLLGMPSGLNLNPGPSAVGLMGTGGQPLLAGLF